MTTCICKPNRMRVVMAARKKRLRRVAQTTEKGGPGLTFRRQQVLPEGFRELNPLIKYAGPGGTYARGCRAAKETVLPCILLATQSALKGGLGLYCAISAFAYLAPVAAVRRSPCSSSGKRRSTLRSMGASTVQESALFTMESAGEQVLYESPRRMAQVEATFWGNYLHVGIKVKITSLKGFSE